MSDRAVFDCMVYLQPALAEAFLQRVQAKALVINAVPKLITHPRDPDDEPYLNLAIVAGARFLVSRDKDLLDLMSDADFRGRSPGLVILDPVAFLRAIGTRQAESTAGPAASLKKPDPA
jgi:predicted nucleic acid-binding protein